MAVFRVNKTSDYTTISNYHFKDKNLSLKAKGLLSQMLSLPNDWDYSIKGLASINKENETAIKNALDELKQCGYLVVTKVAPKEGNNRISYVYDVFEQPQEVGSQGVGFLGVESLGVEVLGIEVQGLENHVQLNTNNKILNNKILNDKNTNDKRKKFIPPTLEEVEQYVTDNKLTVNAKDFIDYFEATGWVDAKGQKVISWKGKIRTWQRFQPQLNDKPKRGATFADLYEKEFGDDKEGNNANNDFDANIVPEVLCEYDIE